MLVDVKESLLVIVDIQERLAAAMPTEARERVFRNTGILLRAAAALSVPVLLTEQYPRGLGPTAAEVIDRVPADAPRIEKTCFSCMGSDAFASALNGSGKQHVIVAGMEAHVCVLQTAIEMRSAGRSVFVVEDACCSRNPVHEANAMRRLSAAGVTVTNTESVLFEWLRNARHACFKEISAMLR